MKELISVIVPVYNVEDYIHKCVDTIVNQTYKNLEIILVDDGSTDNSGKICDELAQTDSRIRVIHKKNGGLSDARNAGIEVAKGEYLGFVDSDDYIDLEMYSVLMKNLKDTGAALATCGRIFVTNGGEVPEITENKPVCMSSDQAIKDLFLYNSMVFHAAWDKLYKRELFSDIKFPVGRLFEDAAIMFRIFEKAGKITATKKQMYYYIQRQGSISNCKYNKNKIMHQFENRINAVDYYRDKDREKCRFAKVWNLRTVELLWAETYENDRETAKYLISETRRNFTFSFLKYSGKKQIVKILSFCISPKLNLWLKKSGIGSVKNKLRSSLKMRKDLVSGYFKNKNKYAEYNSDAIFICGVPEYGNRGDQAIALAEKSYISDILPEREVILIPEHEWYQNLLCLKSFTKKHGNICACMGGGNMGELYPFQENIRLSAVKKLKNAKIVVFPQSIDYSGNTKQYQKARKIYESHKNLTIFTRENYSEDMQKKLFGNCRGYMVPDIVLSYKPEIPEEERKGIIFCIRQDKEKNAESDRTVNALIQTAEQVEENIRYIDTFDKKSAGRYDRQLEGLNSLWIEFKKSELVVTDRLHGMIFSVITGTPCIALDNSTGKVGNFYRTWLEDSGVLFADGEKGLQKAIEAVKSRNLKKPVIDSLKLKEDYSQLERVLQE